MTAHFPVKLKIFRKTRQLNEFKMAIFRRTEEILIDGVWFCWEREITHHNIVSILKERKVIGQDEFLYQKVTNKTNGKLLHEEVITEMPTAEFNRFQAQWQSKWPQIKIFE